MGRSGYKQKLSAASSASAPEPKSPSQLVSLLLLRRAWGNLSSPDVQEIAAAAHEDGLNHPDVRTLASLGSWGKYPGKVHAELEQRLAVNALSSCLSPIELTMKATHLRTRIVQQDIIYPHVLFGCLHQNYNDIFIERVLGGSSGNVQELWKQMKNHPVYKNHPMQSRSDHFTKCVWLSRFTAMVSQL